MFKTFMHIMAAGLLLGQSNSQLPKTTFVVYIATLVEDEFIISCGGSIISSRTVLTSARCMVPPYETYIIAGQQSIDLNLPIGPSSDSNGQTRRVTKTMLHEKFATQSEWDFDIALASFEDELAFTDSVSSLQLSYYWARLQDQVIIFGWESVAQERRIKNLTWAITKMACRSKEIKAMAEPGAWNNLEISTDGVLFVKDQSSNKSICHGYTGSPLVVENSQIGVATFGIDYGCQGLNAMSSIRRHLRWIERKKAFLESKLQTSLGKKDLPSSSIEPRIKDGVQIDSPEQFPFLVALAYYVSDDPAAFGGSYCTGSILTQWIILTAAHCVKSTSMIVYAGIVDWTKYTEGNTYQHIKVHGSLKHPRYKKDRSWYDIALLLLASPLKFNSKVTSVCQLMTKDPRWGTSLSVAGWGLWEDWTKPTYPSWINVTVSRISPSGKGEINIETVNKPTTCKGDSGSAYFNDNHEVAGVDAYSHRNKSIWNPPCPENETSSAMGTAEVFEWLTEAMIELEDAAEFIHPEKSN